MRLDACFRFSSFVISRTHYSSLHQPAKMSATNTRSPNKKMNKPFRVSIEGNIGCGKSTLINYFKTFPDVKTYLEPLDEWRNVQGHNLLELLYTDLKRWNFSFQHMVQLSRLGIQTHSSNRQIHLFERSVQNNRFCFGEMAYRDKLLTDAEFCVFDEWYRWISNNTDIGLDLIVYLRSSPEVVHRRLHSRSRQEESTIPLDYLCQLHQAHDDWLLHHLPEAPPAPVLVLDADSDLDAMHQQYRLNQELILGAMEKKWKY